MASKAAIARLQKEYKALLKEPVPHIKAHPNPSNMLDWHFIIEGLPGSDYEGGIYHGKVIFPRDYPYKPPGIMMCTPNGRFATDTKLCLSMSDFHPESWNPLWSVGTILNGLMSFMYENQMTTGSITTSRADKRRLASCSLEFNLRNPTFRKLFPDVIEEAQQRQAEAEQKARSKPAEAATAAAPSNNVHKSGDNLLLYAMCVLALVILVAPFLPG